MIPRSTEFAWFPSDLAEAFCLPALQLDPNRQYCTLAQCVSPQTPKSIITVDQLYFIGDSRSASELEVFINMPIERLRVGCVHSSTCCSGFAMSSGSCQTNNAAEEALWHAMYPLLCNSDEHVLATIRSLVLALREERTDLPLSGVFGAGKTRSAAILVVGLLVFPHKRKRGCPSLC